MLDDGLSLNNTIGASCSWEDKFIDPREPLYRFLSSIGQNKLSAMLIEHGVDVEALLVFAEADLEELGIAKGPRGVILNTVRDWYKRETGLDSWEDEFFDLPKPEREEESFDLPEPVRATCAKPAPANWNSHVAFAGAGGARAGCGGRP